MSRQIISLKKEKKITDPQHEGLFSMLLHFRKNKNDVVNPRSSTYHFAVVNLRDKETMSELKEKWLLDN